MSQEELIAPPTHPLFRVESQFQRQRVPQKTSQEESMARLVVRLLSRQDNRRLLLLRCQGSYSDLSNCDLATRRLDAPLGYDLPTLCMANSDRCSDGCRTGAGDFLVFVRAI